MKTYLHVLSIIFALSMNILSVAQSPCENDMAGGYPCKGVNLLSHISAQDLLAEDQQGIWINDIWGWTDPDTEKEYALIGMSNGTSFVDVTDPVNPIFLGKLNEHNFSGRSSEDRLLHDGAKSIWRDIKVYKNHAYIVSEDADHGMQVFDLTQLRGVNSAQTFTETANYQGFGSAHNIVINEGSGFAYVVGAQPNTTDPDPVCTEGGLHIIDISTPDTPVYRACFDTDGYTHDAQCVIYSGPDEDYQGKEVCFNANTNSITLVNVDDKDNISMITKKGYTGVQYAHQGWLTEDHKYFLTNDELDEVKNGTNTRTLVWDVQDLDNPSLLGTYEHEGIAIDHNLYIVGDLAYESNYTSGLRVLDLTDVSQGNLSEIAYFDSYPASDATAFSGTWSNYPFFSSGTIIISDITSGLFVVKISDSLFPTADFNYSIDAKEVSFTNTSLKGATYEWVFGDGSVSSTEENPIHEYETGGSYDVKLITTNSIGSHETTQNITFVYTGTSQIKKFAGLNIYPNPSFDQLTINLGNATSKIIQAILTDLKGQVVLQRQLTTRKSAVTIDINHIPHGMYYLTLHSSQGAVTKKVIIN